MRFSNARQAWHDAYYIPWDSVMSHAMVMARLGADVQRSEFGAGWAQCHQVEAGLIQRAIATLPPNLASLGHFLYSPMATDLDRWAAREMLYDRLQWPAGARDGRKLLAKVIVDAAMHEWSDAVRGRERWAPARIAMHVQPFGVRLISAHWARDWAPLWEEMRAIIDEHDRDALRPVARVVATQRRNALPHLAEIYDDAIS